MFRASINSFCKAPKAASIFAWSRAATATFRTSYVAVADATAISYAVMSAPPGNGCVGTSILPREVAGTSSLPARRRASPYSNASSSLRLTSHSSASQSSTTTARTEK